MSKDAVQRLMYWMRDPDLDEDLADDLDYAIGELERLYKLERRLLRALDLLEKAGL